MHDCPPVQLKKQSFKSLMTRLSVTTPAAICIRIVLVATICNGGQIGRYCKVDALVSVEIKVIVEHELTFQKIRNFFLYNCILVYRDARTGSQREYKISVKPNTRFLCP